MKVNIQKLLQGGGFATYTPIVSARPMPKATSTEKTSSEESTSSLLDKKTYESLIKEGGLVNDVNYFVQKMIELESDPSSFLDSSGRAATLQTIAQLNEVRQNKNNWDNAITEATKLGGMAEVAVGARGELYNKDSKGKISIVQINEYRKNPSNYNLLNVSELLQARQYNPELTFNTNVFSVAQNAVGLQEITNQVKGLLNVIGEYSEDKERHFTKEQAAREMQNLSGKAPNIAEQRALYSIAEDILKTPGDRLKITNKITSNRRNLETALNYIWESLGQASQLKLKATAAINGKNDPRDLIQEMLLSNVDESIESTIKPEDGEVASSNGAKSATAFQMFHKDLLQDPSSTFAFNDTKLGVMFKGVVGSTGPLVTEKDQSIGWATLETVLKQHGLNRIVDSNKVYFGDKKVDPYNLSNVIYDGEAAQKVYMPVGRDGMPDYESFKDFKDIYAVYEANKKIWSVQKASNYFMENGYNLKIDENNGEKIIRDNAFVKPFLVLYGYTNDATGLTKKNDLIEELSRNDKQIIPTLESIWTHHIGSKTINNTPDASWNKEDYFKGIITIPYRKNSTAIVDAIVGQGAKMQIPNITSVQNRINYSSQVPTTGSVSAALLTQE